jgi:hypothetical protein
MVNWPRSKPSHFAASAAIRQSRVLFRRLMAVRLCRTTAKRDDAACTGTVVRKPPMKERARELRETGCRGPWRFDRADVGVQKSAGFGDGTSVASQCTSKLTSADDDIAFPSAKLRVESGG